MRAIAASLLLFSVPSAWAGFYLGSGSRHVPVPLVLKDDFWISEKGDSKAREAFKLRNTFSAGEVLVRPTFTDPAEDGCARAGGDIAILYDEKLNQQVFCRFEDGSYLEVAAFGVVE